VKLYPLGYFSRASLFKFETESKLQKFKKFRKQTEWWMRRGRTRFCRGLSCESFVLCFSRFSWFWSWKMPFGRLFFSLTLVFYYLTRIVWWRQKHIQKIYIYIYIGKNSSTCGILLY
jgi:hypothetical protein